LIGGLYAQAHGLKVIRARAFNHAGPGQSGSCLVGSICAQAAEQSGNARVTVRTGAAEVRRDYCDVRDVARAYRLLCEAGEPGIWNVCSGASTSTAEVVDLLDSALPETEVAHEVDPALVRPHETLDIYGDCSKLEAATGWKPLIPLRQTVSDALAAALG
jgi:GDP-4-dehydro-6-deoxy-D-mannose reductase